MNIKQGTEEHSNNSFLVKLIAVARMEKEKMNTRPFTIEIAIGEKPNSFHDNGKRGKKAVEYG
jgi:hypothetical protein